MINSAFTKYKQLPPFQYYIASTFIIILISTVFLYILGYHDSTFQANGDVIGIIIQSDVTLLVLVISINWVIVQTIASNLSPHYLSHYIHDSDFVPFIKISISLILIDIFVYYISFANKFPNLPVDSLTASFSSSKLIYMISSSIGVSVIILVILYVNRTLNAFNISHILDILENKSKLSQLDQLPNILSAYFDTLFHAVKNDNTIEILKKEEYLFKILPIILIPETPQDCQYISINVKKVIELLELSSIIALNNGYEKIAQMFITSYKKIGERIINKNQENLFDLIESLERIGTRSIECGFFRAPNQIALTIGSLIESYDSIIIQKEIHPKEQFNFEVPIKALSEIGTFSAVRQISGPSRNCVENLAKVVNLSLKWKNETLYNGAIISILTITELSIRYNCSVAGSTMKELTSLIQNIYNFYGDEYPSSIRWILEILDMIQDQLKHVPFEGGFYQIIDLYDEIGLNSTSPGLLNDIINYLNKLESLNKDKPNWPSDHYSLVKFHLNQHHSTISK